jgi:hypothetical protein
MVIVPAGEVTDEVLAELRAQDGIIEVISLRA